MHFAISLSVILLLFFTGSSMSLQNYTIDDTDLSVIYSSYPVWDTTVSAQQQPPPIDASNHVTTNSGAWARFNFTGTAIYVYGYKDADGGLRNISVDSTDVVECDGQTGQLGSRALIFGRSGLTLGPHNITITNTGTQGQSLNIDYFIVTNTSSPVPYPRPKTPVPLGTIIGISAGGGAFLLWLGLTTCICCACRKRRSRANNEPQVLRKSGVPSRSISRHASTSGSVDPRLSQPMGHASYYANNPGMSMRSEYNPYSQLSSPTQSYFSASYPPQTPPQQVTEITHPAGAGAHLSTHRPLSVTSASASVISQPSSITQPLVGPGSQHPSAGSTGERPTQLVTVNELDGPPPSHPLHSEKMPEKVPPAPPPPVQQAQRSSVPTDEPATWLQPNR